VIAALAGAAALAAAAASAVQHRQFAAEALQYHLGRVFLDAGVVGPFAGLQGALDIDLRALAQVFLGDLDEPLVEDHDAVPFGALLALAGDAVAPAFRGRQVQIGDARTVLGRADFRIAAEIADQDHLVDAASHGVTASWLGCRWHLIRLGGCSYFILIPAIHRVSRRFALDRGGQNNALPQRAQRMRDGR